MVVSRARTPATPASAGVSRASSRSRLYTPTSSSRAHSQSQREKRERLAQTERGRPPPYHFNLSPAPSARVAERAAPDARATENPRSTASQLHHQIDGGSRSPEQVVCDAFAVLKENAEAVASVTTTYLQTMSPTKANCTPTPKKKKRGGQRALPSSTQQTPNPIPAGAADDSDVGTYDVADYQAGLQLSEAVSKAFSPSALRVPTVLPGATTVPPVYNEPPTPARSSASASRPALDAARREHRLSQRMVADSPSPSAPGDDDDCDDAPATAAVISADGALPPESPMSTEQVRQLMRNPFEGLDLSDSDEADVSAAAAPKSVSGTAYDTGAGSPAAQSTSPAADGAASEQGGNLSLAGSELRDGVGSAGALVADAPPTVEAHDNTDEGVAHTPTEAAHHTGVTPEAAAVEAVAPQTTTHADDERGASSPDRPSSSDTSSSHRGSAASVGSAVLDTSRVVMPPVPLRDVGEPFIQRSLVGHADDDRFGGAITMTATGSMPFLSRAQGLSSAMSSWTSGGAGGGTGSTTSSSLELDAHLLLEPQSILRRIAADHSSIVEEDHKEKEEEATVAHTEQQSAVNPRSPPVAPAGMPLLPSRDVAASTLPLDGDDASEDDTGDGAPTVDADAEHHHQHADQPTMPERPKRSRSPIQRPQATMGVDEAVQTSVVLAEERRPRSVDRGCQVAAVSFPEDVAQERPLRFPPRAELPRVPAHLRSHRASPSPAPQHAPLHAARVPVGSHSPPLSHRRAETVSRSASQPRRMASPSTHGGEDNYPYSPNGTPWDPSRNQGRGSFTIHPSVNRPAQRLRDPQAAHHASPGLLAAPRPTFDHSCDFDVHDGADLVARSEPCLTDGIIGNFSSPVEIHLPPRYAAAAASRSASRRPQHVVSQPQQQQSQHRRQASASQRRAPTSAQRSVHPDIPRGTTPPRATPSPAPADRTIYHDSVLLSTSRRVYTASSPRSLEPYRAF